MFSETGSAASETAAAAFSSASAVSSSISDTTASDETQKKNRAVKLAAHNVSPEWAAQFGAELACLMQSWDETQDK